MYRIPPRHFGSPLPSSRHAFLPLPPSLPSLFFLPFQRHSQMGATGCVWGDQKACPAPDTPCLGLDPWGAFRLILALDQFPLIVNQCMSFTASVDLQPQVDLSLRAGLWPEGPGTLGNTAWRWHHVAVRHLAPSAEAAPAWQLSFSRTRVWKMETFIAFCQNYANEMG